MPNHFNTRSEAETWFQIYVSSGGVHDTSPDMVVLERNLFVIFRYFAIK